MPKVSPQLLAQREQIKSTRMLTLSVREIEVLHRMLSQGMTVADMVMECDERIASDVQPDAGAAKMERLAVMRIVTAVRCACHPQATPRLDGKNLA